MGRVELEKLTCDWCGKEVVKEKYDSQLPRSDGWYSAIDVTNLADMPRFWFCCEAHRFAWAMARQEQRDAKTEGTAIHHLWCNDKGHISVNGGDRIFWHTEMPYVMQGSVRARDNVIAALDAIFDVLESPEGQRFVRYIMARTSCAAYEQEHEE